MSTDSASALFVRDGADIVVPTDLARGPWRRDALHGGAVAALLGSAISVPGRTPVRVTFDLMAAVPCSPLRLEVGEPEGGSRVARQTISLYAGEDEVARAQCLAIRHVGVDLPPAVEPPNPFDGLELPDLDRARPKVAEMVGWECFDSAGMCARTLKAELPEYATGVYVNLLVPVIAGEPTRPLSRAAAAADYASNHLANRLHFDRWSFMNADLTLHLSREPSDSWVGVVSTCVVDGNGAGLSVAQLFDEKGRLGQSIQSLVIEERTRG